MDPAIISKCRIGYFKIGIVITLFEDIKANIQAKTGLNLNVTLRSLTLGSQDPVTGWFDKTFTDSTIEMVILPKNAANVLNLPPGPYAKYALGGFTNNAVKDGDEIIDGMNNYHLIAAHDTIPLMNYLVCFQCDLRLKPWNYDVPSYGTGATVDDPRYRTKVWIDEYAPAPMKNDGVTAANFISCWKDPPYPLEKVFNTKGVDLVYSIGRVQSKPLIQGDHYVYGYDETISITVSTIDKNPKDPANEPNISGENLMWRGECILRDIAEDYPFGSLRDFEVMKPQTVDLGSTKLYSVECQLKYTRGKT